MWASLAATNFTFAQLVAVAVVSGSVSALAAVTLAPRSAPSPPATATSTKAVSVHSDDDEDDDKDDDEDDDEDDEDGWESDSPVQPTGTTTHPIDASKYSNFKMVLVIRKDVEMTKGKVAAQCCHACLAAYNECMSINPAMAKRWERIGQAKITLRCNSEEEMLELQAIARSLSLPAQSIRDAGHTQIAAGTRTVLAIGPAPAEMVDQVTKHLKLY